MTRILILGTTGMLGHTLVRYFHQQGFEVTEANRSGSSLIPGNGYIHFDVMKDKPNFLFQGQNNFDYCINAIGVIKQLIKENESSSNRQAMIINRDFSQNLSALSVFFKIKIIQIATDCVYSGHEGNYLETSSHSPTDLYGRSKSEGESLSKELMHIRSSIIGHELSSENSLMDWLLSRPRNSRVNGFTNHKWNGVTSYHFARVLSGIIKSRKYESGTFHLVPSDAASKFEILKYLAESFNRNDLEIVPFRAEEDIDRTLGTISDSRNSQFWQDAGYSTIPSIREMISEYALWENKPLEATNGSGNRGR